MFNMNKMFARNTSVDLDDSANIKFSLTSLGYYDDSETGLSSYPEDALVSSVKSYQKDRGLSIDGVINPEGETHSSIKKDLSSDKKAFSAFEIFKKRRDDMMEANTKGADKYFHCLANYEARELGWSHTLDAHALNIGREVYGFAKEINTLGLDGTIEDISQDMSANIHGLRAAKSKKFSSGREACAIFRPEALDKKY